MRKGSPSAEHRAVLTGFNEKVTRLESTRFFQRYKDEPPVLVMSLDRLDHAEARPLRDDGGTDGASPSISLTFCGYVRAWVEDFDQDAVEAFVLTYRMLTQDNDRYSVRRLAKVYEQSRVDTEARARLAEARQAIAGFLDEQTTCGFENGPVKRNRLLDVFVYGGLAHSNPEKERLFRLWTANPTQAHFTWVEFMSGLRGLMTYFLYIRELNKAVLSVHFED